jgi:hypothetical protein
MLTTPGPARRASLALRQDETGAGLPWKEVAGTHVAGRQQHQLALVQPGSHQRRDLRVVLGLGGDDDGVGRDGEGLGDVARGERQGGGARPAALGVADDREPARLAHRVEVLVV